MFPDANVINEIAAELGIEPAFVEKDWYSVQVLKAIAENPNDAIQTVFAGGTSLSKGYGLIQRFSEDLDFRCRYVTLGSGNQNKKARSAYRSEIVGCIQAIDHIDLDESNVAAAITPQYPPRQSTQLICTRFNRRQTPNLCFRQVTCKLGNP